MSRELSMIALRTSQVTDGPRGTKQPTRLPLAYFGSRSGHGFQELRLIEQTLLVLDADVPSDIFKDGAGGYLREFFRLDLMQAPAVYTAF